MNAGFDADPIPSSDPGSSTPQDQDSTPDLELEQIEHKLSSLLQRRTSSTACRKCHSRKVKCSGGQPCNGCRQTKSEFECIYPRRQRQIKVSEDDLGNLLKEIQQVRCRRSPIKAASKAGTPVLDTTADEIPWFLTSLVAQTPVFLGSESSEASFATRCRHAISDTLSSDIPKHTAPSDEYLMALAEVETPWPSAPKAQMLVHLALRHMSNRYHVVLRSEVLRTLEQAMRNPSGLSFLKRSKMLALFAIGDLYSSRAVNKDKGFPGIYYFTQACKCLSVMNERPHLDVVEIRLLLSFYSLTIHRRNSAYNLAGSAIRLAVLMGLHLNLPESELVDPVMREHRNGVWWTCYGFERMWGICLGNPVGVYDNVINVNLPASDPGLDPNDFADPAYYVARARLAQVAGQIFKAIYLRRNKPAARETLQAQRVQDSLKNLLDWRKNLPPHLCIDLNGPPTSLTNAVSLYLSFNQCVIIATRPILLYIIRGNVAFWRGEGPEPQVPASAIALADACARCARHNIRMLLDSWLDGSFPTFDWLYAQYLYSACLVEQVLVLIEAKDQPPHHGPEQLETAIDIISQLRDAGHFGAKEFYWQIDALRVTVTNIISTGIVPGTPVHICLPPSEGVAAGFTNMADPLGLEMSAPTLQDLLMQPSLDLEFFDDCFSQDVSQSLDWSTISPDNRMDNQWAIP